MDFDFSDELKALRDTAAKFLAAEGARAHTRRLLNGEPYDPRLWRAMAALGWTGATIPEAHGGSGLGPLAACTLAGEIGYAVAGVPFSSSVYLATEALLNFGTEAQRARWLPKLAAGEAVGTFAIAEGSGPLTPGRVRATVAGGKLSATKLPVPDGELADFAVVVACDEQGRMLHLVELAGPHVRRARLPTLDHSRPQARIDFDAAPAEVLGAVPAEVPGSAAGWDAVRRVLDRAAVMMAFEQIGGAQAALDMARDFALARYAFGKPIASFQAIKHKLADVYVAIELARSSAYYGAWALAADTAQRPLAELPIAASSARIAATEAAWVATRENQQTHGGIGYTWEMDCHLYYRRARLQGLTLGSAREWKRRLMDHISPRGGAGAMEAHRGSGEAPQARAPS